MKETTNSVESFSPYLVGELLTLHRVADSSKVVLRIREPKQSQTLSCGMVVDLLGSSYDKSPSDGNNHTWNGSTTATQTVFLKLYDWRFATQLRDDAGIEPWTQEFGNEYAEMVMRGDEVDGFVRKLSDQSFREATEEDWDAGQNEASLAHEMLTMYRAETSVYRRLGDIQGTMVPRFLDALELDITPYGIVPSQQQRRHFLIKGILLEYIPGFNLSDLSSQAPPEACQGIVDQGIRIVHALSDRNVLNKDVRPDNFIVNRSYHNEQEDMVFRVAMIDFGQSRLRREDESDLDWGRAKWQQDEEGAVGQVMQHQLKRAGIEISYVPSYRYLEFAEGE
ncbi:casein kinase I RAG8 [Rhypophila decipiens]|uniref:Casein kinase I RAG8 n=1 Tax=Rhypophila decipiens TaxID=261697 RepID=A0AAN7B3Q2_9PEZI|nr:casein kinase I RAG8 [Rhypophila decipiens]